VDHAGWRDRDRALDQRRFAREQGAQVGVADLALGRVELAPGLAASIDQRIRADDRSPGIDRRAIDALAAKVAKAVLETLIVELLPRLAAGVALLDAVELDHGRCLTRRCAAIR
jgi:hypothetical protein